MAKRLQGLITGIIIGMLMAGSVAYAATKTIEVSYNNIKIVVDGTEIIPKGVDGTTIEPFISNGTTYLPVRAIANALGKAVYWDGPNYTVYLGTMDGTLEYPTLKLGDATNIGGSLLNATKRIDNYGNSYDTVHLIPSGNSGAFQTLLNMKYSKFKGIFFVPEGTATSVTAYYTIEVDGKVVYTSPNMSKTSQPEQFDINVSGGNEFKITLTIIGGSNLLNYQNFVIGDAGFYQ